MNHGIPEPKRSGDRRFHPGEYLAEEMEARDWGPVQLAERTGLSPDEIRSFIENEDTWTVDKWERIARAFGTSVAVWMQLQVVWKRAAQGAK